MNDNATALTQLKKYKFEKEALTLANETTKKAKVEVEAKVVALLKDKVVLKKIHIEVEAELNKAKDIPSYLQVKVDATIGERDHLADELQ